VTGDVFEATDFNASRATALDSALSGYRIVHFATHGVLDSERPSLSGLILSLVDKRGMPQNGYVRLHDIYNMRLDADWWSPSRVRRGSARKSEASWPVCGRSAIWPPPSS
jgi:hypothetical protein